MLTILLRCILYILIACVSCTKKQIPLSSIIKNDFLSHYYSTTNTYLGIFKELDLTYFLNNWHSISSKKTPLINDASSLITNTSLIKDIYFKLNLGNCIIYTYISINNEVITKSHNNEDVTYQENDNTARSLTNNIYKQIFSQYMTANVSSVLSDDHYTIPDEEFILHWIIDFVNLNEPHYYQAPLKEQGSFNDKFFNYVHFFTYDDSPEVSCEQLSPYSFINRTYESEDGIIDDYDYSYENSGANNVGYKSNDHHSKLSMLILAPVKEILLDDRMKCFHEIIDNINTVYNVTLHVDNTNNFGHAFLTIEKSNGNKIQRLSYGFYPKTTSTFLTLTSTIFPTNSAIGEETEDGQRVSDIRYIIHMTGAYGKYVFNRIIDKSLKDVNNPYILTEYNCTNYAVTIFNEALTNKINNTNLYLPSDLYTLLKEMKKKGNSNIIDIPIYRDKMARSTKCS